MPRPNDPRMRRAPSPPTLQIAAGGAVGTALRLLVGGSLVLTASSPGPLRLLAMNAAGAALLGALTVLAQDGPLARWTPLLATGMLGGLTTFSALIVQSGGLGHQAGLVVAGTSRMTGAGLLLAAGYLAASVLVGLGAYSLGRRSVRRARPARSSPPSPRLGS